VTSEVETATVWREPLRDLVGWGADLESCWLAEGIADRCALGHPDARARRVWAVGVVVDGQLVRRYHRSSLIGAAGQSREPFGRRKSIANGSGAVEIRLILRTP